MHLPFKNNSRKESSGRPVSDILTGKGGESILLKKRDIRLELSFRRTLAWFWRRRRGAYALLGILGLIFFTNLLLSTRASSVEFHPGSCLGGFENPENAEGNPDVADGNPESFTAENSAVLRGGSASQIFCGGFEGEIPPDTNPKSLSVRLSWTLKENPSDPSVSIADPSTESTSTPEIGGSASSTDPLPLESDIPATEVGTEATSTETTPAPTSESTSTDAITPPTDAAPPSDAPVEPEIQSPAPQSSEPDENETTVISGFIFPRALAAEEPIPETSSSTETVPEEITDSASTSSVEAATSTIETTDTTSDDFLSILYTLDGVDWEELSRINSSDWQTLELKIPVEDVKTWEDVSKIQISIQSLSTTGEIPTVYLDAITLSVEYEDIPDSETPASDAVPTAPDLAVATGTLAESSTLTNFLSSTSTDPGDSVTYSREPARGTISGPVSVAFSFGDWERDMNFTDIFGNRQNYWWIEIGSAKEPHVSPCYASSTMSAYHSFDLPNGDYTSVTINAASDLRNCERLFGGSVRLSGPGYGEPEISTKTKIFSVSK